MDSLPSAASPAGVDFATDSLISAVRGESDSSANCWVFLVGGPGNGKSFQVQKVIDELALESLTDADGLARRSRWNNLDVAKVLIVNDATIRPRSPEDNIQESLARELQALRYSAGRDSTHALISVNRGILIEEQAEVSGQDSWQTEFQLISWLVRQDVALPAEWQQSRESAFYRRLVLPENDRRRRIDIHAVYLDQLSLFERQPELSLAHPDEIPKYRTMRPNDDARDATPAAELIRKVVDEENFERSSCGACPCKDVCPLLANAKNLRNDQARIGLLEFLRSSEVVSGHLYTYRDLWSVVAAAVAGNPETELDGSHKCQWIQSQCEDLTDPERRPKAAYNLSRQRYFDAMFHGVTPFYSKESGTDQRQVSAAIERVRGVDPVIDAARVWTEPVLDCVQAISYEQLPLEFASRNLDGFQSIVSKIDSLVEGEIVGRLINDESSTNDLERRAVLRWRGQTLFRMYGMFKGVAAHNDVSKAWLNLRLHVGDSFAPIPSDSILDSALRYLLLPPATFEDSRYCLLPLFEPRVIPVSGPQETPIWCHGVAVQHHVRWSVRAVGDALEIGLFRGQSDQVAKFELDFNICRESLACVVHGGHRTDCRYGFTELGNSVSPRLERIRASFLAHLDGQDSDLIFIAHSNLSTLRAESID